jgi:hypothetical protein
MKTKSLLALLTLLQVGVVFGQTAPDTLKRKEIFDKKFFWGGSFNNALTIFKGSNMPDEYFWKPALGVTLKAEYYFHKNIGVSVGFTYQQKGAGIITPDFDKSLGDPDSTHRARIKTNALEIPLVLILRSGDFIRGVRLHGEIGITPMKNRLSKHMFMSVEDGFHVVENQSDRYYKKDIPIQAVFGVDMNAGNACVFQVHLFGNWGTKNVFNTATYPGANGKNVLYGIRLGWMF